MKFAVIPAAGKSLRMGRPKLALPLGNTTVLERVIHELHAGGVDHVLVVVGPHVAFLAELAQRAGAHVCLLPHDTPDMRATVTAGLHWLSDQFHPSADDDWFLVPADQPLLTSDVVRQLAATRLAHPDHSIVVPTYQGQRGHPVLLAWHHVAALLRLTPELGLNVYLRQQADRLEMPVTTNAVLLDLDTPADYARLLELSAQPNTEPH